MEYRHLPDGAGETSILGLGCARLGSVTSGLSRDDALKLIREARDLGIAFFDTANIYAQGQSERILGEALADSQNIVIATKAGQVFPLPHRLLMPFRGAASKLAAISSGLNNKIRSVRSKPLPRNFTPSYLRRSLTASLRRLKRDDVEMFLLHSPSKNDLTDGVALDCLTSLKREGLARWVGVSCDDAAAMSLIADDARVEIIQVAYGLNFRDMAASVKRAAERGAYIIAREILKPDANGVQPKISAALSFALGNCAITPALIGTTRSQHLRQAASSVAINKC